MFLCTAQEAAVVDYIKRKHCAVDVPSQKEIAEIV
jgi:hypothetical protein